MKQLNFKKISGVKAIISVALLSVFSSAAPKIWDGTADTSWYNPNGTTYNLMTAEHLAGLAQLVNKGNSFAGKTITLGADIFLNDTVGVADGSWAKVTKTAWTPIGTSSCPFKGEFDGVAGKTNRKIYGLYFNNTKQNNVGLFGATDGAKISNLDLVVGKITGASNTGALVGSALSNSITNVHSEVNVTGQRNVGGLVGYSTGSLSRVSVQEIVTGQDYVGGLAGQSGSILDSYAEGSVNGKSYYVGGLVGYAKGTISSSFHTEGNVKGKKYVGGLAGNGMLITNSYAEGIVVGDSDYVGGLVGYTTGKIDLSHHTGGNIEGRRYVGGLAGYGDSISNSYAEGFIKGKSYYVGGLVGYAKGSIGSSYYTGGNVEGNGNVGGLAGHAYAISNSYAEGSVKGYSSYVGGLVGSSVMINSSHHMGGNVEGGSFVGGLAGRIQTIDSCYHIDGFIKGDSLVGGLVGEALNTVANSYSEGNVVGKKSYVGGLIGRSTNTYRCPKYYCSYDTSYLVLLNSHHKGDVDGLNFVGGAIGLDTMYRDSSSLRSISRVVKQVYAQGAIHGKNFTGGVVGKTAYGEKVNRQGNFSALLDACSHFGGDVYGDSSYTGGVAGFVYGYVRNSHSEGNVIGGNAYVGGLVGLSFYRYIGDNNGVYDILNASESSAEYNIIVNSYSIGDVKGASYVGGVVGLDSLYLDTRNISYSNFVLKLSNAYSRGFIQGGDYTGGIVGKININSYGKTLSAFLNNCSHFGDVKGTFYVGGLAGFTYGSVNNSFSEGNVVGSGNYVGGLVGLIVGDRYTSSTSHSLDTAVIEKSYSIGNVSGSVYVGGVIGKDSLHKRLKSAYSHSNSKTISRMIFNTYSEGNVDGVKYVGGLIGMQDRNCDSAKYVSDKYLYTMIDSSFHKGNVNGSSSYVAGIVGFTYGPVKFSHSIGNIIGDSLVGGLVGLTWSSVDNSHSEGNVSGKSYVGGLSGYNKAGIKKSHAKGSVNGNTYIGGLAGQSISIDSAYYKGGDVVGSRYVGGLSGYNESKISNSYAEGMIAGNYYVGGVAGYSNSIDSVYYKGGDVAGYRYVGGLSGYNESKISNSYAEGLIEGNYYVGGLAGYSNSIDSAYHENGDVVGCSPVGGLAGGAELISFSYHREGSIRGCSYVGGLVGHAGDVINSSSKGDVFGTKDSVGGLVGYADKIRNSYAQGSVKGQNFVGGLAGYVTGYIDVVHSIADSVVGASQVGGLVGYASKTVDSSYATGLVKGDDNVGGLIGSAYGYVSNSYALGDVIGNEDFSSTGNDNLGGLVGYQYSGSINKSMALGNVSGTTKLGGLVGRFDGAFITQSYANGNVTGNYFGDPADKVGNYYIGGLVGYAKGSLNETYSSGIVKGVDEDPVFTGCMVGYVNGSLSVTNSYYDKSKCSLGIDGGEESVTLTGVPDKTTAEMQTKTTFEDWDFVDTWKIIDDSYPFLQIYANSLTNATIETATLDGYKYDGTAKTPLVLSVKLFGETLEYETEYTIAYENNVNAGTAHINVCGVKPYGGCKVVDFEIAAIPVEPTIAAIENMTYTGRALTPEIKVYNGETLLASTDYIVEYKDNVNAGMATASVTMKGNYSGSASQTFKIEKTTPVISQNPKAGDVVLGQTLASSELIGGKANVEGMFEWKTPSFKPTLENEGYAVVFVPADTANYTNSEEIVVPIKVLDMAYVAVHAGIITIDSMLIFKGSSYALPNAPDSVGYDFVGFYQGETLIGNVGDEITISENTVIDAVYKIKTFIVTFMNGSTVLQSGEVAYGVVPIAPKVTLPENTAQYTYSFEGWDKEIVAVTEAVTYNAVIDSVVNKYQVVFKDYDGTVLKDSLYAYGTLPIAPTVTLPENTAKYTYSVAWNKEVVSVTGSATYTAIIDSILNKYEVVFKDYDGSVLKDSLYAYGTAVKKIVKPANPKRETTAMCTYTFKGWTPEISSVTEDVVYTAEYDSTIRSYTVAFVNGSTKLQSGKLLYGSTPEYNGNMPTKKSNAQYTYTFKGWNPEISSVTGAVTYTAIFDSTLKEYVVTFLNGKTKLQTGNVAYGSMPVYLGDVPTKAPTDSTTYKFVGWEPELATVSGKASYVAKFETVKKTFMVRFMNKFMLDMQVVSYGETPVYTGAVPTKEADEFYSYSFIGWSPEIGPVTRETDYVALFDSTDLSGIADFRLANLEMSVNVVSRNIQISAAPIGSAYAVLDMQGRVLRKGRVESANFNVSMPESGHYLVRVGEKTKRVSIK